MKRSKRYLFAGKHVATVDFEDYERLSQHRWRVNWLGNFQRHGRNGKPSVSLCREALGITSADLIVLHQDRDKSNNCRANLYAAKPGTKNHNEGLRKNNSSGFKGVHWSTQHRKWTGDCYTNGKRTRLGVYETAAEAALAYDEAATRDRGPDAVTNASLGLLSGTPVPTRQQCTSMLPSLSGSSLDKDGQ